MKTVTSPTSLLTLPACAWLRNPVVCALLVLSPVTETNAQELLRGKSAIDRAVDRSYPEVKPLGVAAGVFRIFPAATLTLAHDDNAFATETNKVSSLITILSPEFSVLSNWGAHALNISASADIGRYSEIPSEDFNDWQVLADARLDIRHTTQLSGAVLAAHDHVNRTSPDSANGLTPTEYDRSSAYGRYLHQFGRFSFIFDAAITRLDFDDVVGIRNGMPIQIDQDDRDRNEYDAQVWLGYKILPEYEVFTRLSHNRRDYDNLQKVTNFDRSSEGYEAVIGITRDLGSVVFGKIFAGILRQEYNAPYTDIDTPVFGARLRWNPTGLTTFGLELQRGIRETLDTNFSSYISTRTTVTVDHELRTDVTLNASLGYIRNDFQGIGTAERDDSTYEFALGPTYLINRYLYLSAQYQYFQRQSDVNLVTSIRSNDFAKNIFLIQLRTQL